MATYSFSQVDVFGHEVLTGNPVAVVHDASGLEDRQLADLARWTNLSETTFLLPPTDPAADYRVRIFTPGAELPFAGHPTLGTAHAWLALGGTPAQPGRVVQECGVGLVEVRQEDDRLAFAAPGFLRSGPVSEDDLGHVLGCLGLEPRQVVATEWIDNGPGWLGIEVDSAATVLSLRPDFANLLIDVGVLGPHQDGEARRLGAAYEVRAFCPGLAITEDPVTGSLNAGFGVWLTGAGRVPASYVARQGTAIGRDGRVHVDRAEDGTVWVGGVSRTVVQGSLNV